MEPPPPPSLSLPLSFFLSVSPSFSLSLSISIFLSLSVSPFSSPSLSLSLLRSLSFSHSSPGLTCTYSVLPFSCGKCPQITDNCRSRYKSPQIIVRHSSFPVQCSLNDPQLTGLPGNRSSGKYFSEY